MMPNKPSSKERIDHIFKAIQSIQIYTQDHDSESFLRDDKTIDACLYQYTIIGEAITKIDTEILKKYDYPWYKVKSFRNFILHDYHAIELRIIWDTTTEILPGLKEVILKILEQEF